MAPLSNILGVLLDIEGTTSSISFVHDVMFPFALDNLEEFLTENFEREDVRAACDQVAKDTGANSLVSWAGTSPSQQQEKVLKEVRQLMANDVKATGLKALQGLIWAGGFKSGEMKAHVYSDVIPAIQKWKEHDIDVRIFSSGSVAAQKLFFGHLDGHGDCLELFTGHYDTNIGGKKEADSYQKIAADWGISAASILFMSDIPAELTAAKSAGLQACLSIRPGNHPVEEKLEGVETIESFEQIQIA